MSVVVAVVLAGATAAHANVGTPLMHTSACFLLFINLFIGWFEGGLIAHFCGAPRGRAIGVMILANYASAWAGALSLGPATRWLHTEVFTGPPLHASLWVLGALIVGTLVASVAIELPFALYAGSPARTPRRTAAVFAGAQTASHIGVVVLFGVVSQFSLFTQLTVERNLAFVPESLCGWVYYVGEDEASVWRVRLDGRSPERIADLGVASEARRWWNGLYGLPNPEGNGWDLWIGSHPANLVVSGLRGRPGFYDHGDGGGVNPHHPTWWAADLRPKDARPWYVTTWSMQPETGLRFERPPEGEYRGPAFQSYAFAHPFELWRPCSATVLPGGFIVVEFGPRQILMLDAEGKRVAVLARGKGPVVALDAMNEPEPAGP